MIERSHPALSVGARCRLLLISRSSFYYAPLGETSVNLTFMRPIDRQFLETPFYGVQQMPQGFMREHGPGPRNRAGREAAGEAVRSRIHSS